MSTEDTLLLDNLNRAGIDTMVSILRREWRVGFTNMKCSNIPLQKRKGILREAILGRVNSLNSDDKAAIIRMIIGKYFAPRR